uniref:Paired domain-containing protein n=1 Tax=Rhodnius prolixus TaxID=13249 RepID=T1I7Q4_RHOPR
MVTLHLRLEQFISGFKIFWSGHMGTSDAERSGRPVEVTTPEIIDKIHDMVMDVRRVKVREIASAVGISNERVHNIWT